MSWILDKPLDCFSLFYFPLPSFFLFLTIIIIHFNFSDLFPKTLVLSKQLHFLQNWQNIGERHHLTLALSQSSSYSKFKHNFFHSRNFKVHSPECYSWNFCLDPSRILDSYPTACWNYQELRCPKKFKFIQRSWMNLSPVFPSCFILLLFSHSVVSNSLWPHEQQLTRPPCPSLSPFTIFTICTVL